ncbi:hypothetical protein WJX73_000809 [Symbiochloris irregularis]|uniref:AB hydrolase-1 domain-containing protein n=1 Tax=Symbiochloris irregularis TaxID=706552 RepID=A0AAW1PWC9_9CHLO
MLQSPVTPSSARCSLSLESAEPYIIDTYTWHTHQGGLGEGEQDKGYKIAYTVVGEGKPVVLVHGFGASIGHWRKNIPKLAQTHKVYAVDLLGFGRSDKPPMAYSTDVWKQQLLDFARNKVGEPAVYIGNSLGSLICLMAASELEEDVQGLLFLNCAGGMNNKCTPEDWRVKMAMPFFALVDFLLSRQRIARALFNWFRSPKTLRKVLSRVYVNPEAVDDALIDLINTPSGAEGALEAFVSMITGDPGPRPEQYLSELTCPLLLLWGTKDPFTPLDGPVGRYFKRLPESHSNISFEEIPDTGHCPHDDRPEIVNKKILAFLGQHHA